MELQVASSSIGHGSENSLENYPSRDQSQVSSTVLRQDNQTLTTCGTQDSRKLSSQTLDEKNATIPSVQGEYFSSRSNTWSSFTDDDTDWGEDDVTSSVQDLYFAGFSSYSKEDCLSQEEVKDNLTRPVISPMKQELIDRIMKEFWVIFNQESEAVQ